MRYLALFLMFLLLVGCGRRSTKDWLEQLHSPVVVKRREAIRELSRRPADVRRIVPALMISLKDENAYVRHDAALALGKFSANSKDALLLLTEALHDKDRNVRHAAEWAIKEIDPEHPALHP